jgi:hypothetical protein
MSVYQDQMIEGRQVINVRLGKHLMIGRAPKSFLEGTKRRVSVRGQFFFCPKQKVVQAQWSEVYQEYVVIAKEC